VSADPIVRRILYQIVISLSTWPRHVSLAALSSARLQARYIRFNFSTELVLYSDIRFTAADTPSRQRERTAARSLYWWLLMGLQKAGVGSNGRAATASRADSRLSPYCVGFVLCFCGR
jgi:hypothetical protein